MRLEAEVRIDYSRHVMLLGAVSVVLVLTQRWRPTLGAVPSLAVYGALHSASLVAALRPPQRPQRKAAFVTVASCLALLSGVIARSGGAWLASTLDMAPPAMLLSLCSGLGAASYAGLIRCFWNPHLKLLALTVVTLSCVLSTLLALALGTHLHVVSPTWFVVTWWWTFSAVLWSRSRVSNRDR